jgi:ribose 5-phosphate isomerase B
MAQVRKLRIVVGSDDAGYRYKSELAQLLREDPRVASVIDVGVASDQHTKYADVAEVAGHTINAGDADRALLICGTGLGMAISANKVSGIRAVTAHDIYSVERSVLSNNAQALCMGERVIGLELAKRLVDRWLDLRFDSASHSYANVQEIDAVERRDREAADSER